MRLEPHHINAWRAIASWSLRAVSLALLVTGGYLILKRVILALAIGDLSLIYSVYEEVGEAHSFSRGVAMIAFGIPLGALAPRIAGWLISSPATSCPACGYEKVDTDRCPECGLPGFVPRDNGAPPRPPP